MFHIHPWLASLLAVLLSIALLATACGGSDDTGSRSDSTSASETSTSSSESSDASSASGSGSASASDESEEPDADESAGDRASSSGTGETVVVADVLGDVEVTVTSDGVYALDEFAGIALLTLGVTPIAVDALFEDDELRPVPESLDIPINPTNNLEALAAAMPELILGIGHPNFLEVREQHNAIASTVTPDFTDTWQNQTLVFATATGTEERAETVITTVEARTAELRSRIDGAGLSGARISIIQTFGPEFWAYGPSTLVGTLVEDLGFTRSELQSGGGDFGFIPVAEEFLTEETTAEIVIGMTGDVGDSLTVFDSPVVDPGDAFAAEVVRTWSANNALAAWIILDDLESILFGDGTTTDREEILDAWDDLLGAIDAVESGDVVIEEDTRFPRTIEHSLGETTLDEEPRTIVPLFGEILGEQLIALGITPAGALPYQSPLPATGETYGLEALYDVTPIGTGFEPSLELIAALEPDLIISDDQFFAAVYEPLSGIAPTYALDIFSDDWQANFRLVAEVVGREDRAEEVIAEYEARVDSLRPDVEAFFDGKSVAVMQETLANEQSAGGEAGARIYGADTNPGRFLADLGVDVWEPADPGGSEIAPSTYEISTEAITTVDADAVLYLIEPERFVDPEAVEASAIWQATPAVGSGQLYFLDFGTQVRLGGPLHKFIAMDAVEALITGGETGGVGDVPDPVLPEPTITTVVDVAGEEGSTLIPQFSAFSPDFAAAVGGEGPVTAFLPSDDGLFAVQGSNAEFAAALQEDFELLDEVLRYHAIAGVALTAEEVIAAGELETLLGESITVEVVGDEVVLNGGQARVSAADLVADNGIAHVIDSVLIPPSRAAEFGG
ncbi:MAG: ABC transporter substrate-binding protein [Actinomycetota bacterium]